MSDENDGVDDPAHLTGAATLGDLISQQLSRRAALKGLAALAVAGSQIAIASAAADGSPARSSLTFGEIAHGLDEQTHVAPGYDVQVLIRWGDPVLSDAPQFDPHKQTAAAQEKQFGYNNDFTAFLPLPAGSRESTHGLLCVNHEYTLPQLMFPFPPKGDRTQVDVELAAHGHSVLEIRKTASGWKVAPKSKYARRLSMLSTEMVVSGPAAGHDRLKTSADPAGRRVIGTLNNCAGGVTPWGTVLVAEENFNVYFAGAVGDPAEARNHKRYEVGPASLYAWSKFHERFDLAREPHEPNRFGWMVEYDPYDPASTPVKRTALGRCKHEGAAAVVAADGRVVFYCGDDSKFEYLYKFVSARPWNSDDRQANQGLLDEGTLYVAQFAADGTLEWLPLVHGQGPLTSENGFGSQAEVLIETRRAADLLKATPLDRPEDIEVSPATGRVYVMLTNNIERAQTNAASPRLQNKNGHIIELAPPGEDGRRDHAATRCEWNIFLLAGDPAQRADGARYNPGVSVNGWLTCPDNCAIDPRGRLWIATDGMPATAKLSDGLYACDTTGPARALPRLFFNSPVGAEVTGPCFTPDGTTLFVSVQHPGDSLLSTFNAPSTRWPDFQADMPPRPSVVAITKHGGGEIGG
jgi:uncharacterized protein